MPARTITFDRLVLQSIRLTRNDLDPVRAEVAYEISATDGRFAGAVTFSPTVPAAVQTQLNSLWDLALAAAKSRESLP